MTTAANPKTSGGLGFNLTTGSAAFTGTGSQTAFLIPHGLGVAPNYFSVIPTNALAAVLMYVTADATNISINCLLAPTLNNSLTFNWITTN